MSTPQRIHENVQTIRAELTRLDARRRILRRELLCEVQKYIDALNAKALSRQGAAAVEAAERAVRG